MIGKKKYSQYRHTAGMEYVDFHTNSLCNGVIISDRAYKQILCQMLAVCDTTAADGVETGGVFLGHVVDGLWYIVESVDQGLNTTNKRSFFEYDNEYINHTAEYLSMIYKYPLTILGIWHRHPGSMDRFSTPDEDTMRRNAKESRMGIISMLVNVDPNIRMTFYHCSKEDTLMKLQYAVGDEYFIKDLMEYRSIKDILVNEGKGVGLIMPGGSTPEDFVHSMAEREERKRATANEYSCNYDIEITGKQDGEISDYPEAGENNEPEDAVEFTDGELKKAIAKMLADIADNATNPDCYMENADKLSELAALVLHKLDKEGRLS